VHRPFQLVPGWDLQGGWSLLAELGLPPNIPGDEAEHKPPGLVIE